MHILKMEGGNIKKKPRPSQGQNLAEQTSNPAVSCLTSGALFGIISTVKGLVSPRTPPLQPEAHTASFLTKFSSSHAGFSLDVSQLWVIQHPEVQ